MEFRLTTLGTIALRRADGSSIESILQQPRRLSLLVFLAMAGRDTMVRRDEIAAMFWPDADAASCRNALSQVLHYLRKSLGADAIITRGNDEIALNPAVVSCDAVQVLQILAAGDPRSAEVESALDLYCGTFMPGLFDAGSATFEQWVDKVRDTVRLAVSNAAWARANALADAGEVVGAAALARRAAVLTEADEVLLRAQMTLLARVGDRAGALDAFDRFARMLQSDFEMRPSAVTLALAETIRESEPGAPMAAPAAEVPATAPMAEIPMAVEFHPAETVPASGVTDVTMRLESPAAVAGGVSLASKRRRFPLWAERLATVAGSVVVAGTILISWAGRTPDASAASMTASVMVPGFGFDAADDELAATGRRLRETLIHSLAAGNLPFPVIDGAAAAAGAAVDISAGDHFQVIGNITRDAADEAHFTVRIVDRRTSAIINSREFPLDGDAAAIGEEASDFARYVVGAELDIRKRLAPAARDLVIMSHRARTEAESLSSRRSADVAKVTLSGMDAELAAAKLSGAAAADVLLERAEIALARMFIALFNMDALPEVRAPLAHGLEMVKLAESHRKADARSNEIAGLLYHFSASTAPARSAGVEALRDSARLRLMEAVKEGPDGGRAWSTLSVLYFDDGNFAQAQYAAEQALRADMYARDAAEVRIRLFRSGLESGDIQAADAACRDISRVGLEWWGEYCKILIVAWSGTTTAPQAQHARQMLLAPESLQPQNAFLIKAATGVVLANGGFIAEAEALYRELQQVKFDEVVPERAWLAHELGKGAAARADLNAYVATRPDARSGVLNSRRYSAAVR